MINSLILSLSDTKCNKIIQLKFVCLSRSGGPNTNAKIVMDLCQCDYITAKKIHWILSNKLTKEPRCLECNNIIPNYWKDNREKKFCSNPCFHKNADASKLISKSKIKLYSDPVWKQSVENKKTSTTMKNYGVLYPMQNAESFEKQKKSSFQTKLHKGMELQGYEPQVFDFIEGMFGSIQQGSSFLSCVNDKLTWIDKNGKSHATFPDFYVDDIKSFVEVKGDYTREIDNEKIMNTAIACRDKGYGYYVVTFIQKKRRIYQIECLHDNKI